MAGYLYGVLSEGNLGAITVEHEQGSVIKNHPQTGEDLYVFEVVGSKLRMHGGLAGLLGCEKLKGKFFVLDEVSVGENIALMEGSTSFPFMPFVEKCYRVGMALPEVNPYWDIASN